MRKIINIFVGLLVAVGIQAQVVNPVHWSSQPMGDSIVVTATIDSGWHMTLISIADSIVGEEYADTYSITLPLYSSTPLPLKYNACNDQLCTAPEIYYPTAEGGQSTIHNPQSTIAEGDSIHHLAEGGSIPHSH